MGCGAAKAAGPTGPKSSLSFSSGFMSESGVVSPTILDVVVAPRTPGSLSGAAMVRVLSPKSYKIGDRVFYNNRRIGVRALGCPLTRGEKEGVSGRRAFICSLPLYPRCGADCEVLRPRTRPWQ